ncbi:ribosomal protein L22 [candidate division TM7 genomosp. GTL1]|nr:ribosomal protein L22 [candidate division TM7 genomosp. GTL1]
MAEVKTVRASAKGVDQTPRKVGLIASLIRGRSVADALLILENTPKRAAKPVAKVVASARANAVNTHGLDSKSLRIQTIHVSPGQHLKRYRAAAMGRALPYQKRTSHINVVVSGEEKPRKKTETTTNASKESK